MKTVVDDATLRFPTEIAKQIGLNVNEIGQLKRNGCPFHGKKTSVRWVRLFLDQISGAERLIFRSEFPQCPLTKILEGNPTSKRG